MTILGGEAAVAAVVADELAGLGIAADRLAGPSRFETAVAIAERSLGERPATTALIARAFPSPGATDPTQAFADALAAGAWAAESGFPLLFTATDALPEPTAAHLSAAGYTDAVVIGGEAAVSPDVAAQLEGLGLTVERVAGRRARRPRSRSRGCAGCRTPRPPRACSSWTARASRRSRQGSQGRPTPPPPMGRWCSPQVRRCRRRLRRTSTVRAGARRVPCACCAARPRAGPARTPLHDWVSTRPRCGSSPQRISCPKRPSSRSSRTRWRPARPRSCESWSPAQTTGWASATAGRGARPAPPSSAGSRAAGR